MRFPRSDLYSVKPATRSIKKKKKKIACTFVHNLISFI